MPLSLNLMEMGYLGLIVTFQSHSLDLVLGLSIHYYPRTSKLLNFCKSLFLLLFLMEITVVPIILLRGLNQIIH